MTDLIAESAVREEGNVARRRDEGSEGVLEVDEEGLGAGWKEGEEVDGSFDLKRRREG